MYGPSFCRDLSGTGGMLRPYLDSAAISLYLITIPIYIHPQKIRTTDFWSSDLRSRIVLACTLQTFNRRVTKTLLFCFQYQLKAIVAIYNYFTDSIFLKCITTLLYIKPHCIHVILWADITDNLQIKQVWQTGRTWIYIREDWHVEYS